MKIIVTRDGYEKSKSSTGSKFDEAPAIKFLYEIMNSQSKEGKLES